MNTCMRCKKTIPGGILCARCYLFGIVSQASGTDIEALSKREGWPLSRRRLKAANDAILPRRTA